MRRGGTLVEASLVTTVFLIMLVAIMDFGRLGFAYDSVTFAAHRAARWAAMRGNSSGHAATAANVLAAAQGYTVALNLSALSVTTTWTPDNHPGSLVQVVVAYSFQPLLIPVSASAITLESTSSQVITQ